MKKIINVIICISIFLVYSLYNVSAIKNSIQKISISELQYINELQKQNKDQLLSKGYTVEQINQIYSMDIVKAFRDRAKLSSDTLKEYGYTENEIIQIKKLDQNNNLDVETIIKYSPGATVSLYLTGLITTSSNYVLSYYFTWSACPYCLYDDIIGFAWQGVGTDGGFKAVAINTSSSYITLKYQTSGGALKPADVRKSVTSTSPYSSGKIQFKVGNYAVEGSGANWVYYGTGKIYLDAVVPNSIYEISFSIAYGHSVLNFNPSFSVTYGWPSISFGFNTVCNQEAQITKRYRNDGTVILV